MKFMRLVCSICTLLLIPLQVQSAPGDITSVAGIADPDSPYFAGVAQPAASAWDSLGNLYVVDTGNHRILKIAASGGAITTVAGTGYLGYPNEATDEGPATLAPLNSPLGICFDSDDNLYIADTGNHIIRKVNNEDGLIQTVAGVGGGPGYTGDLWRATSSYLNRPTGVAVDSQGNIYIADSLNQRIRKVDASTKIMTTVAGNGGSWNLGDNGPATDAGLNTPTAIILDGLGHFYIADSGNNRVRKVDSRGVITSVAGNGVSGFSGDNGLATSAQLNRPNGISLDASGNLYIADQDNHRIRKLAPDGTITTVAGSGSAGYSGDDGAATSAQLSSPQGISVDSAGHLYIADSANDRLRKVSGDGTIITLAGMYAGYSGDNGAATSAQLNGPRGIAVDSTGNLYIADTMNSRVRKVAANGTITTLAGTGALGFSGDNGAATSAQLNRPYGLTVDGAGNIYIADTSNYRIRKVAVDGTITTVAGRGGSGPLGDNGDARLAVFTPTDVSVDSAGNLYIVDWYAHRIRKVDSSSGIITTVAGIGTPGYSADNVAATNSRLNYPQGVALDSAANLYIADTANHRVRKVDSSGMITTLAGTGVAGYAGDNGLATAARLDSPRDISIDSRGNLYISDNNHVIRKVDSAGIITTVTGTGSKGYFGDNGPALSAQLNFPSSIVLDSADNLYIADSSNHRIRKIAVDAPIVTGPGTGEIKLLPATLAAGDQAGLSVAMDGDYAIVGAPYSDASGPDSGAVFVYQREASNWIEVAQLTPDGGSASDRFGFSVAISGDLAIVGASGANAAYIFQWNGTAWRQQAELTASDAVGAAQFGYSVSISGDGSTAIVGAKWDSERGEWAGAAYIFKRDGGDWVQETKIIGSQIQAFGRFAQSVAISDQFAIIGGNHRDASNIPFGVAYLFEKVGLNWLEHSILIPTDSTSYDYFGGSVAIDGNYAIVGASGHDSGAGGENAGAAYIYYWNSGAWSQQAILLAGAMDDNDAFGSSVSIKGDFAVVGTPLDDDGGADSGASYLFSRTATSWAQQAKLIANDATAGDRLGFSVAVSGDYIISGAHYSDDGGVNTGSAYIFSVVDGDNDGTSDALQAHVSSFQNSANSWLTYRNSGNFTQSNAITASAPLEAPTDRHLVNGVARLRLSGLSQGETTNIEVFVSRDESIIDYMMLGNDGRWYELGATVSHIGNKTKLVFAVTEGGNFDTDAVVDGVLNLAQGGAMVRSGFEISPYAHSFGLTGLGTATPEQLFTLTNKGSRTLVLGAAAISGSYSNQFNVMTNTCTGQSIAAGASCVVGINMQPTSVGSKSAWLQISSDDPDNASVTAFLSNYESKQQQARRRLPPVLHSLSGLPEVMNIGQSYTVTWQLLGYHDNYFSTIVFFDCSGVAASTCGSNYSDHFESSGVLSASSVSTGNWTYNGVQSKRASFSYTFTPTAEQFPSPADIVIRFYRKNTDDSAAGKGSLSLIIPGNLSDVYYDTSGRRIQKRVE